MRPLVEFKKIPINPQSKLAEGVDKYKESKQKESALEGLTDDNIETIINGRKLSFKKFKKFNAGKDESS